ncbi:MAG: UbiA family prenyltransferase [Lewinellaceae bacterium]|nr:UbiA family prenyltransferase [Lewinellaceae bacterium]
MSIKSVWQLLRIEHWVKNLFIFIPAFFAARFSEALILERAIIGFIAFSLVASAVYVLNDLVDAPQDRNHPDKCRRPIASGAISRQEGIFLLVGLLLLGTLTSVFLCPEMLLYTLLYFVINVAYSFSLKHFALIDISLIGLGFLLRVLAGGL